MRIVTNPQMTFGGVDISKIKFDLRCRDEIPKMLLGFQEIYITKELRDKVFNILEDMIPVKVDKTTGRLGMELWTILVLGSLRLNCNWDYDKVHDSVNNHKNIRQMIGLGENEKHIKFRIKTIKGNVSLFTVDILNRINEEVVKHAQISFEKKNGTDIKAHCDSFVLKTNVHYPTDINLLNDAMRKMIIICHRLCKTNEIEGWRQWRHLIRTIKNSLHHVQNVKRMGGKDKIKKEKEIKKAHIKYLEDCSQIKTRIIESIELLKTKQSNKTLEILMIPLENFIKDADRQMEQITRRVLNGEKIPADQKIFSIFERHTEWIVKGKAGVTQELGVKVCVIRDQNGFILNHMVMENLQDVDVAFSFTSETLKIFPNLKSCSYDKGFYSPDNIQKLSEILDTVIMPKKGKLNKVESEKEKSAEFTSGRRRHSSVESSISALENHGLDICPDKGINGFKRYVALAILARNIQMMGHQIQKKKLRKLVQEENKANKLLQVA